MLTTILTSLAGGGLGALMRLLPEVIKFFSDKGDRDHEYRMTSLQLEIDKARAEQQIDLVHAQGDANANAAMVGALTEALKGQAQLTGIFLVDLMNQLVRPLTTYWWLTLYSIYKAAVFYGAWTTFVNAQTFAVAVWTPDDMGILSMLLSFWFVGRVFDSSHKK